MMGIGNLQAPPVAPTVIPGRPNTASQTSHITSNKPTPPPVGKTAVQATGLGSTPVPKSILKSAENISQATHTPDGKPTPYGKSKGFTEQLGENQLTVLKEVEAFKKSDAYETSNAYGSHIDKAIVKKINVENGTSGVVLGIPTPPPGRPSVNKIASEIASPTGGIDFLQTNTKSLNLGTENQNAKTVTTQDGRTIVIPSQPNRPAPSGPTTAPNVGKHVQAIQAQAKAKGLSSNQTISDTSLFLSEKSQIQSPDTVQPNPKLVRTTKIISRNFSESVQLMKDKARNAISKENNIRTLIKSDGSKVVETFAKKAIIKENPSPLSREITYKDGRYEKLNQKGQLASERTADGTTTSYKYNEQGYKIGSLSTMPNKGKILIEYNSKGQKIQSTKIAPNKIQTKTIYDPVSGLTTKTIIFKPNTSSLSNNATITTITNFAGTDKPQLIEIKNSKGEITSNQAFNPEGGHTTYAIKNKISKVVENTTISNGIATKKTYDKNQNLKTTETTEKGNPVITVQNKNGSESHVTFENGSLNIITTGTNLLGRENTEVKINLERDLSYLSDAKPERIGIEIDNAISKRSVNNNLINSSKIDPAIFKTEMYQKFKQETINTIKSKNFENAIKNRESEILRESKTSTQNQKPTPSQKAKAQPEVPSQKQQSKNSNNKNKEQLPDQKFDARNNLTSQIIKNSKGEIFIDNYAYNEKNQLITSERTAPDGTIETQFFTYKPGIFRNKQIITKQTKYDPKDQTTGIREFDATGKVTKMTRINKKGEIIYEETLEGLKELPKTEQNTHNQSPTTKTATPKEIAEVVDVAKFQEEALQRLETNTGTSIKPLEGKDLAEHNFKKSQQNITRTKAPESNSTAPIQQTELLSSINNKKDMTPQDREILTNYKTKTRKKASSDNDYSTEYMKLFNGKLESVTVDKNNNIIKSSDSTSNFYPKQPIVL